MATLPPQLLGARRPNYSRPNRVERPFLSRRILGEHFELDIILAEQVLVLMETF
jgi:hypothetical protein